MGASLLTVVQAGDRPQGMSITWAIAPQNGFVSGIPASAPDVIGVPPFAFSPQLTTTQYYNNFNGYKLDVQNVQSATDFGIARSLHLSIVRAPYLVVGASSQTLPGRVFVQVQGTGDVFEFPVKTITDISPTFIFDVVETSLPIWSKTYTPIWIWIEPTITVSSGPIFNPQPGFCFTRATLSNFERITPGTLY